MAPTGSRLSPGMRTTIIAVASDAHAIKVEANNVAELYVPLTPRDFSEVFLVARARRKDL